MPSLFSHCLTSGSNIAFSCMPACFLLFVCSAAGEGVWFEYVLAGVVITTLVTHFLHLTSPHSVCHVSSASLCCVRKFKVLKLAFLDLSARGERWLLLRLATDLLLFFFFFLVSSFARRSQRCVVCRRSSRGPYLTAVLCAVCVGLCVRSCIYSQPLDSLSFVSGLFLWLLWQ